MYIVLEIQKSGDTVSTLVNSYANRNAAEQQYHTVLAAAAVSVMELHSAVLMTEDGISIKHESFEHPMMDESE